MSQWGSSDSGILRKNKVEDSLDQLLIFGYSCKIFRDDEKAQYVDHGKHLIPWMGDENLKIDRYDCRGALSDLKKFEASREGYDALRWMGLSETEKKLEELCDKERYYSLENNEEEEQMYKEEAAKRSKMNAFSFNYQSESEQERAEVDAIPTVPEKEEEDVVYKPSPILDVPVDINMPKTVKEYARIEKTALFVCRQGPQMEILLKAKQANNPQFSFLTMQDPLNKFYRHLLAAFKNGRYQPQCDQKKPSDNLKENPGKDADKDNSEYLHPSLISATNSKLAPTGTPAPNLPYRPSSTADCAYSQLVTRIQQGTTQLSENSSAAQTLEQQYHQFYYVQQFYEYWRTAVLNSDQGAMYSTLPLDFNQLDANMQGYIHQHAWAQFLHHHQTQKKTNQPGIQLQQEQDLNNRRNNSYAQIVSNLNKDGGNPYSANVPQLPPPAAAAEITKIDNNQQENNKGIEEEQSVKKNRNADDSASNKKRLLSLLAAYGSDSEDDSESSPNNSSDLEEDKKKVYKIPPLDVKILIDKMAEYVFVNGAQFEEIIKQKQDPRFQFLHDTHHEYHKYYRFKLCELKGVNNDDDDEIIKNDKSKKLKLNKKVIAPVSFSIIKKPAKDEISKEIIKCALPLDDEDSSASASDKEDAEKSSKLLIIEKSNPSHSEIVDLPRSNVAELSAVNPQEESISSIIVNNSENNTHNTLEKRSRSSSRSQTPIKQIIDMFIDNGQITPNDNDEKPLLNNGINNLEENEDRILEMIEMEREREEKTDIDDDKEIKARRLERKRKAAMFLKLKTNNAPHIHISDEKSIKKSSPSSSRSNSSRRNSTDSVIFIKSRRSRINNSDENNKEKKRISSDSNSKVKTESRRRRRSRECSSSRNYSKSYYRRRRSRRSRSKEEKVDDDNDEESNRRRKKDKKKRTHRRKHSKSSKKRSRRHNNRRSTSRSYSKSRSRSRCKYSRNRSRSNNSAKSHISINSS